MKKGNITEIIILKRNEEGKIIMSQANFLGKPFYREYEHYDQFSGTIHTILPINFNRFEELEMDIDDFMNTSEVQAEFKKTLYGSVDNFYKDKDGNLLGEGCGFYNFIEESLGENDKGEYIIFHHYMRGGKIPGRCNIELHECTEENLLKLGLFEYNGEKIDEEFNTNLNLRELVDHGLYDSYRIKRGYDNGISGYTSPKVSIKKGDIFWLGSKDTIDRLEQENITRKEIYAEVDKLLEGKDVTVDEEIEIIWSVVRKFKENEHTPSKIAEGIEPTQTGMDEVVDEMLATQNEKNEPNKDEKPGEEPGDN